VSVPKGSPDKPAPPAFSSDVPDVACAELRGIPTEAVLAEMRARDPPVQYLVGTPKGRLSRLEKRLLAKPWQQVRIPMKPPGYTERYPRTVPI
jgi:hypothetical protein